MRSILFAVSALLGLAPVVRAQIRHPPHRQHDDDRVAFAIPAATSAAGLLIGAAATRHQRDLDSPGGFGAETPPF